MLTLKTNKNDCLRTCEFAKKDIADRFIKIADIGIVRMLD
jgi:hypothetical protein